MEARKERRGSGRNSTEGGNAIIRRNPTAINNKQKFGKTVRRALVLAAGHKAVSTAHSHITYRRGGVQQRSPQRAAVRRAVDKRTRPTEVG